LLFGASWSISNSNVKSRSVSRLLSIIVGFLLKSLVFDLHEHTVSDATAESDGEMRKLMRINGITQFFAVYE
jgi:hypothetical protein